MKLVVVFLVLLSMICFAIAAINTPTGNQARFIAAGLLLDNLAFAILLLSGGVHL